MANYIYPQGATQQEKSKIRRQARAAVQRGEEKPACMQGEYIPTTRGESKPKPEKASAKKPSSRMIVNHSRYRVEWEDTEGDFYQILNTVDEVNNLVKNLPSDFDADPDSIQIFRGQIDLSGKIEWEDHPIGPENPLRLADLSHARA